MRGLNKFLGEAGRTAMAASLSLWFVAAVLTSSGCSGGAAVQGNNPVPSPSITTLNPAAGPVGTSVTITGTNFGASKGSSTVTVNGTLATPTSWSATSIVVPVPNGATTGSVVVTVGGVASNGMTFTVTTPAGPSITSLNPNSGPVGTSVTITGMNFGASEGSSTVTLNGILATPTSWSATSIVVSVPNGATTGNVVVTVGGVASNGMTFTVTTPAGPSITSLNPNSGPVGTSVTITGMNFGASEGSSTVTLNGILATPTSWSATSIVVSVPNGATTGNVVVTVGGVPSNGLNFAVQTDTTPPVVTITAPTSNATVSGTITLTATATDPDSAVSFVQFMVDGKNTGAQLTTAPYSTSLDTTTVANGSHSLTAIAQDPSGNKGTSGVVPITVSNSTTPAMGPLVQSGANPNYFVVVGTTKAVLLGGSHSWNDFQDQGNANGITPIDFNAFLAFLKQHGHDVTILEHRDLPQYCNFGAGGTWRIADSGFPWMRSSTAGATDGGNKFDLSTFNATFFNTMRSRVQALEQNGVYAIVRLFDGRGEQQYRCTGSSPNGDGFPFTGANNINGVDDGGGIGFQSEAQPGPMGNFAVAYMQHMIDTLNDLPNVIWELDKEAPDSTTAWHTYMLLQLQTYEAAKPFQHPVNYVTLDVSAPNEAFLYNSNAMSVSPATKFPSIGGNCGAGTPTCKVVMNDGDHSYPGMWNDSAQTNRQFIWQNFANGMNVEFQDPYLFYYSTQNRNLCDNNTPPAHGVCLVPDSRWDNFRDNLGAMVKYGDTKLDLVKMTPQPSLSSTGFCLAQNVAVGAEFIAYFPNGGAQTVDLSIESGRMLNVEWFDPVNLTYTSGGAISGGSSMQSFSPPWGSSYDAVLYLVDAAGHN